MFNLPQPSMALNSHDVPPPDYQMYNTYKVSADTAPEHMLGWTAKVGENVRGGLRCVVFNSHGSPGKLHIGTGITPPMANLFKVLNGKVNTIFIVACEVAQIGATSFDGNLFCGAIAKASGATVFCSTALQSTGGYAIIGLPFGQIDEYEGIVYRYKRDGSNKAVDNDYIRSYVRKLRLGL
ncbi:MAG: hypothetical protein HYR55_19105 [Acidobacteria bacterium]|nr:hypothetical protein [Acidobacteriota bacterium]MBI3654966.1 hypothetical protein [Acidobacteriota bacterium]